MDPITIITAIAAAVPSLIAAIQFLRRRRYQEAVTTIVTAIEQATDTHASNQIKKCVKDLSVDDGTKDLVDGVVQEVVSKL